eukprot:00066.XXX_53_1524_1 [CDS] Oithona nana genome sequencing.
MEGKGRAACKKKSQASTSSGAPPSRRFTAEQMPIQGTRKNTKNILTFMEKQKDGPFSALQKCVTESRKIKVSTRKLNGVRGTCTGILVAFDKHWNLAMIDVDETYNRPRYRKPEALMELNKSDHHVTERVGESVIRVLKTRRNTELCQRHVPQIVLRGEQILSDQIAAVKNELKSIQDKCGSDQMPKDPTLEEDVIQKIHETEVFKKSAPEGNVDDPNVQYFLAFAELEKSNAALRQQETMVREKIKALEDEEKSTKSLVEQYRQMSKAITVAAEKANDENDINEINAKKKGGQAKKSDAADLDNKIRATRKLYKEFKTMLSEYLAKIDPVQGESGGHLSVFLQHLWDGYQKKEVEYLELSDLPFDVEKEILNMLVTEGIIETNPDNIDQVKLVDFVN